MDRLSSKPIDCGGYEEGGVVQAKFSNAWFEQVHPIQLREEFRWTYQNLSAHKYSIQMRYAINVDVNGRVSGLPCHAPIEGELVSAGLYKLTCPPELEWLSAVGSGSSLTQVRTINTLIDSDDPHVLNVAVFDHTSNLASEAFDLVGALRPYRGRL